MRVLLATRSGHKRKEIGEILASVSGLELLDVNTVGLPPDPSEDVLEIHDHFLGNALAKARHFAEASGLPTLADDSGICIHALGGAPGVRSRRFAADADRLPAGASAQEQDAANNLLLLERLEGIEGDARSAHYVCAAALWTPGVPGALISVGTWRGLIAREPRGEGGFGYDPLFRLPGTDRTAAELTREEKNRTSHRARAIRGLAAVWLPR